MLEADWPVNQDWQKGQSRPEHVNLRFYSALAALLIYLGVVVALILVNQNEVESSLYRLWASEFSRFDPLLMLPAMLLLGLLGLPGVAREFARWRRQRGLVLTLDPVPAAPDGELGGSLIIPLHLPANAPVRVTLNCMRRVITKGKNASVRDELLWQAPAVTRSLRSIKGTRVEFCVRLSPEQPATSFTEGKRKVWWAIRVEEAESGFDAVFPVPVSQNARQQRSNYHFSEQERQQAQEAASEPVRSWEQVPESAEGISIDFPAGRSGKAAWILMLVGLVFTGVAVFMGYNVVDELSSERISYFALMVQGMILLGFGLFSPGLLLVGIYMRCNRLRLLANARELVTTRRFMGLSKQRSISVEQIAGMAERIVGRVGQGVDSELEYAIDAYLKDGMRVRLGDGIQGQTEAEQLLEQLSQVTGITHRPNPDEYRLQRRTPPGWVRWLPLVFRLIGTLVFGLTIAAFVLDFM
ncbi:hypothetical protein GCM10009104_04130 [Marinobacterium maritimum]|uniref:RING-type E3 ubiquitin transferase n=1 Tax=Marinobacterium maritimum TaxID=500162 RepID=A0ABN1I1Z9_9GAMM